MRYSETPARHTPAFGWRWMEKEPFVPSPSEALAGLGRVPWHALRADRQVENQLCIAGSRQAGLPPGSREREPVYHPFTSGKYKGVISSQNIIPLVALLAKCTSTLPSNKAVPQKMKDMLLCDGIPPPFCPCCSYKKLLT